MKSFVERISLDIGSEVAIGQVIKALSFKRVLNAVKILASFLFSIILKKAIVWGYPPIVNVEPTNLCNLKCPLCTTGSGDMQRPRGKMNFEIYRRFVDQVADKTIYMTLYHQGEPYLLKDFNRFVRYAKDKGMYVNTSTNAHFFEKKSAREVVDSGLDSMIISLDGVTQDSYSRYRVGGSLETVLNGIRRLVDAKKQHNSKTPYLFLQFLVMKHNESEIPAVKKLAKELGVDRLLIKTIQVMTVEEAHEWLPEEKKYRRYDL
ncbi:radical SAM protein, partial [candidate division KSB1 bacterium]|nr:radical SAM protein [candidate division KSB1 bacterium]